MPAGGKWITQNKKRPGAYINFVAVPAPVGSMGTRGVVAIAVPATWGPTDKLIELYSTDLIDGKSLNKVGCTAFDTEASLPFRLALAGCYKALVFRTDAGGVKATATLAASFTADAKYTGTTGNNITIKVVDNTGSFTITVLVKDIPKESFTILNFAGLSTIKSEWLDISPTAAGNLIASAGINLSGGTNGIVATEYTTFFALIANASFQCFAIASSAPTIAAIVNSAVGNMRDTLGKAVQAVAYSTTEKDYEGIITVNQGFIAGLDTVGINLFPLYVASITAGANVNESNTGRVVSDATKIIGEVPDNEIADKLAKGWFLISYRQDAAVIVEQDINSLHVFTVDKTYSFSKNRVIRCLDEIGNTTALTFNRNYKGKIDNNLAGRNSYKAELISRMDELQGINAIQNFAGSADITVLPGQAIDAVVVELFIQTVDSMEKLYMTVNVG